MFPMRSPVTNSNDRAVDDTIPSFSGFVENPDYDTTTPEDRHRS
jgi:hypothetical protein